MTESANRKTNEKNTGRVLDIVFAAILFLFPFLHVNTGLDAADTAYNLLNFSVFPNMNKTWAISTLLANLTGHFFSKLPFGNTMLGMNIYCTVLCSTVMVLFYLFLRNYYNGVIVFIGLLIAENFCWCPQVILYHYLSYFLFCAGVILLLFAIQKEKTALYLLAGGVLALNAFVRFPNVVETLSIVVLFLAGILKKKPIWKELLLCILGYFIVFASGIGIISLVYGKNAYPDMIKSLFQMTEEATSYTPKSMLNTIFGDYKLYVKFFLPYVGIALLGGFILFAVKKTKAKIPVLIGMTFVSAFLSVFLNRRYGAFNFDYVDYRSIFMWGTFLLMLAIMTAVYTVFNKNREMEYRLLAMAVLCIIFITPIGSNNGLYTAFNNMFFVSVFLIGELYGLMKKAWKEEKGFLIGIVAMGFIILSATLLQSFLFRVSFLFHDTSFVKGEFTSLTGNPVVAGIRTDRENAQKLQEINDYLNENNLKHKKAICYDAIPGFYYFFEEECALSHSWAGLDSFPTEELKADLEALEKDGELPVFITDKEKEDLLNLKDSDTENVKEKMFADFLQKNGYREVFRNDGYIIYMP